MFKQTLQDGWQQELPDNWLRRPDPWEVPCPYETVLRKIYHEQPQQESARS